MKTFLVAVTVLMTVWMPAFVRAEHIRADLIGYQEVPSVSKAASGEFNARITRDASRSITS
jgi:hypothetical protein